MFSWDMLVHFHFLRPWWLSGFFILLPLFLFQIKRHDLLAQWKPVIAPHLLPAMIVAGERKQWFGPIGIMAVTAILALTAMAGPSWERRPSPFAEDNAALVIALDLSSSMEQNDIQPSRLQRAKQKILDLLALRGDAYTGLIAYAGTAHTVIPLSNDRGVISHFLDAVAPRMMPRDGKIPETILPVVDGILGDTDVPATVLLIGDGAAESALAAFEQYFTLSSHQLMVWGMGLTQDQIDAQALEGYSTSMVPLQESMLTKLAASAGGHYQRITLDKADVERIYHRIDNYLLIAEDENRPWVDAGYGLVFPLLLLLALWFRKGWTLLW